MWSLPCFRAMMATGTDSRKEQPMATSLYELSVPTFLQTVTAMAGFLDRAAVHCAQTGADPDELVEARLFADMAPFHFQIEAAWHHAVWGVEALRTGAFTPPALVGPVPFAALRAIITEGQAALAAFDREEIDGCAGKELDLQIGPRRARLHGGDVHPLVLAAQLPFPRGHRLRHPALARRAHRQARLRGPTADQGGLDTAVEMRFSSDLAVGIISPCELLEVLRPSPSEDSQILVTPMLGTLGWPRGLLPGGSHRSGRAGFRIRLLRRWVRYVPYRAGRTARRNPSSRRSEPLVGSDLRRPSRDAGRSWCDSSGPLSSRASVRRTSLGSTSSPGAARWLCPSSLPSESRPPCASSARASMSGGPGGPRRPRAQAQRPRNSKRILAASSWSLPSSAWSLPNFDESLPNFEASVSRCAERRPTRSSSLPTCTHRRRPSCARPLDARVEPTPV
jgi:hypothetical protein